MYIQAIDDIFILCKNCIKSFANDGAIGREIIFCGDIFFIKEKRKGLNNIEYKIGNKRIDGRHFQKLNNNDLNNLFKL